MSGSDVFVRRKGFWTAIWDRSLFSAFVVEKRGSDISLGNNKVHLDYYQITSADLRHWRAEGCEVDTVLFEFLAKNGDHMTVMRNPLALICAIMLGKLVLLDLGGLASENPSCRDLVVTVDDLISDLLGEGFGKLPKYVEDELALLCNRVAAESGELTAGGLVEGLFALFVGSKYWISTKYRPTVCGALGNRIASRGRSSMLYSTRDDCIECKASRVSDKPKAMHALANLPRFINRYLENHEMLSVFANDCPDRSWIRRMPLGDASDFAIHHLILLFMRRLILILVTSEHRDVSRDERNNEISPYTYGGLLSVDVPAVVAHDCDEKTAGRVIEQRVLTVVIEPRFACEVSLRGNVVVEPRSIGGYAIIVFNMPRIRRRSYVGLVAEASYCLIDFYRNGYQAWTDAKEAGSSTANNDYEFSNERGENVGHMKLCQWTYSSLFRRIFDGLHRQEIHNFSQMFTLPNI